jgi:FtsP/CotA-like multicopper oxidase with cupredoxin domain
MHQIGNEGGFFGTDHDIQPTINNFEYNKRSVTVLNVQEHGLFLGSAERADVVVDFSAYAGKTLILYNDAPAPAPAGDPRIDYYTGVGDQSGAGGAINTLPGYGPNTRTIMRVKVANTAPAAGYDFAQLNTDLGTAYRASQAKPIVPALAYNDIFPGIAVKDTYANIFTGTIYLGNFKPLTFTTTSDIKYTPAPGNPIVTSLLDANGNIVRDAYGKATTVTTAQARCTTAAVCATQTTTIKDAGLRTAAAGTTINTYVENKTIQELFDPNWGRMNATLGIEQPFVSALIQTTIPLGYVDPATEFLQDGETQIWKITHNGVDQHPVHFHLVNLQVVNRVGWDGTVKAPYPEDIGWKETIKMAPLEDIIVAATSKKPVMPFGLPHSYRAMDPSQPLVDAQGNAVIAGFTQINALTGNPAVISNAMVDYKSEYVWHCHILGHEENDFMRSVVFDPKDVAPDAPTGLTPGGAVGGGVLLSWVDPTPAADAATPGNAKNEIGFRVERAPVVNGVAGKFSPIGKVTEYPQLDAGVLASRRVNALANATSFTDAAAVNGDYDYRVYTVNAAGESVSAIAHFTGALLAPTNLAVTSHTSNTVTLGWTDNATNEASYLLSWAAPGSNVVLGSTSLPINSQAGTATGLAANTPYAFSVAAVGNGGAAATVGPIPGTTAPVALNVANPGTGTASTTAVSLPISWTNSNPNPTTLTGITVTGTVGATVINQALAAGATGITLNNLPLSATYALTITVSGAGGSAATTVSGTTAGFVLTAATGLAAQVVSQVTTGATNSVLTGLNYSLSWTDTSLGETGYKVEVCRGTCTATTAISTTANTNNRWYSIPAANVALTAPATPTGVYSAKVNNVAATQQNSYYFRVSPLAGAVAAPVAGPASNISAAVNLNNAPAAPSNVSAVSNVAGAMTVSWTDTSNANQAYQVQYALARTVIGLNIVNAGRGYTSVPTVTITPAAVDVGRIAIPATAAATVNLVPGSANYGRVTGLSITNPGSGYSVAPTVTLSAGGGSTLATATATVSGNPVYTTAPVTTDGIGTSQTINGLISGRGYLFRVSATGVTGSQGNSAAVPNNGLPAIVK